MKRFLPVALALAAAVIAGLAVSLLLVGYTTDRNDPVGNLSPRAPLPAETGSTTEQTTTGDETTTSQTSTEDEDDTRGGNRGSGSDDGSEDDD